ncbi:MAG: glycosyltransferase [Ruminococcaceae bacterium]|nr:glycosyltransferase [Oscillospiraceae bacterium]
MSKTVYIGRFTPTTGGVTAKNSAIFSELSKHIKIKKLDLTLLKKGKISMLFSLLNALCTRRGSLIIGTTAKPRRFLSKFLYYFNRKVMNRSVLMVMGGAFGDIVSKDKAYQKWVSGYKAVFVETERMKNQLEAIGLTNIRIFENCRRKPETKIEVNSRDGRLKCVCFSMIYPEKGIDTVLQAAKELTDITFDFWGPIDSAYEEEFLSCAAKLPNCHYRGVFKVQGDNVYNMLNGYDLLLFPTRMEGEGVPGTLIEAKIAALPSIVSDVAHNSVLVQDGINGIVLKENTVECLIDTIKIAEKNDEFLTKLKCGAKESGKKYYFEKHIDELLSSLK